MGYLKLYLNKLKLKETMETNNLIQKIWNELNANQDSYVFDYSEIEDEVNCAIEVTLRKQKEEIIKEILKHTNCKVMHNLGKHGNGEMTCLDKMLEFLDYKLNSEGKFFSSQP